MIELLLVAEQLIDDGAYDRAELLFAQVSQADPRNAIAVAGLARVALARGDRDRAFDEARRALAIDPEEVAAQRLIDVLIADATEQESGPELAVGLEPSAAPDSWPGAEPDPAPNETMPGPPTDLHPLSAHIPGRYRGPTDPAPPPAMPPTKPGSSARASFLDRILAIIGIRR